MRTCRDVLNRLLYDNVLNLAQDAFVGYLDRFKGAMELPLQKFGNGDIPMHRILYFRHGTEVIWHKETRLDLLFSSSDPNRAFTPEALDKRKEDLEQAHQNRLAMEEAARAHMYSSRGKRPSVAAAFSDLERIPVHQCSILSGQWISSKSVSPKASAYSHVDTDHPVETSLQVATFNVLSDVFLPKIVANLNEVRWNAILKNVQEHTAHVWIFTEATPQFANHLLCDQFIQRNYFSSDSYVSSFHTLCGEKETTGQLVLIRRDISVKGIFFAKTLAATGKRLVFAAISLPSGKRVALCALHLTSGQPGRESTTNAVGKRQQQLEYVVSKMNQFSKQFDLHILAGDFNFKSEQDEKMNVGLLQEYIESDATALGPTYDTVINDLAGLQSKEPKILRLDRIYLRNLCSGSTTSVRSHHILGQKPIEGVIMNENTVELLPHGIHASDHFGVCTDFLIAGETDDHRKPSKSLWSSSTALALMPDSEVQEYINSTWRQEHDPACEKWPAHVNLLYPFVSEDILAQVCSSIRDAMIVQGPDIPDHIEMGIESVQTFKHKSSSTVYLKPIDHAIKRLREMIMKTTVEIAGDGPEFSEKRRSSSFTPHLTIGKLKNYEEHEVDEVVKRAEKELSSRAKYLHTSKINKLSILKKFNGKMVVIDEIEFPKTELIRPMKRTLELVKAMARQIFGPMSAHEVIPVGSSTLLQVDSGMDLDVVILPPANGKGLSALQFSEKMRENLHENIHVRCVADAHCPIIHMNMQKSDYLPVDIMYGENEFARQAIADSAALLKKLKEKDSALRSVFREALTQLKRWARLKRLTGKAFTMFPGVSWSILLFSVCPANEGKHWHTWKSLLASFFDAFQECEWNISSITIDGVERRHAVQRPGGSSYGNNIVEVISPASHRNVTSFVSRAVVSAFQKEACKALSHLISEPPNSSWGEYVEQDIDLEEEYRFLVDISVYICDDQHCENVSGWLKGKFVTFALQELETRGISIRPTNSVSWSRAQENSVMYHKGTILCGIDQLLTSSEVPKWEGVIREAERNILDKFLRWTGRPAGSSLSVTLR